MKARIAENKRYEKNINPILEILYADAESYIHQLEKMKKVEADEKAKKKQDGKK